MFSVTVLKPLLSQCKLCVMWWCYYTDRLKVGLNAWCPFWGLMVRSIASRSIEQILWWAQINTTCFTNNTIWSKLCVPPHCCDVICVYVEEVQLYISCPNFRHGIPTWTAVPLHFSASEVICTQVPSIMKRTISATAVAAPPNIPIRSLHYPYCSCMYCILHSIKRINK